MVSPRSRPRFRPHPHPHPQPHLPLPPLLAGLDLTSRQPRSALILVLACLFRPQPRPQPPATSPAFSSLTRQPHPHLLASLPAGTFASRSHLPLPASSSLPAPFLPLPTSSSFPAAFRPRSPSSALPASVSVLSLTFRFHPRPPEPSPSVSTLVTSLNLAGRRLPFPSATGRLRPRPGGRKTADCRDPAPLAVPQTSASTQPITDERRAITQSSRATSSETTTLQQRGVSIWPVQRTTPLTST